jgi:sialate O-acetylesterase
LGRVRLSPSRPVPVAPPRRAPPSRPRLREIAGEDGRFVPATARIEGKTLVVSSPKVAEPKNVRYGWTNSPVINLFNSEGLPASPFTSEDVIPAP